MLSMHFCVWGWVHHLVSPAGGVRHSSLTSKKNSPNLNLVDHGSGIQHFRVVLLYYMCTTCVNWCPTPIHLFTSLVMQLHMYYIRQLVLNAFPIVC
jgi:hypothetical protein